MSRRPPGSGPTSASSLAALLDVELNDELTTYAGIAYPMPVKGLRTMLDSSALTDTEGCYCGPCMNTHLARVVESIRR